MPERRSWEDKPVVRKTFRTLRGSEAGTPFRTRDGHLVVMRAKITGNRKVLSVVWECVTCGTSATADGRSPPAEMRTDCQTALAEEVLDT